MPHSVTQITQAVTNSERVNVFLNGKFWLGMSKNNLLTLKLTKGIELSDDEKREIEKVALNSKHIERAIRYTQMRPRSCGEVRDYLLYKKRLAPDEVENVIAYMQEKDLLSNEKFAQWYVDYKLSSGVNGLNKIKIELLQKKVDKKIIAEVLERAAMGEEFANKQLEKIEEYARKALKTVRAKDKYELKSKLVQKLMARGFRYEEIKVVISMLVS